MSNCPGKNIWPELLGTSGDAAAAVIERENGKVDAMVVRRGTDITQDFSCDRVWVWVDENGDVISVPAIG